MCQCCFWPYDNHKLSLFSEEHVVFFPFLLCSQFEVTIWSLNSLLSTSQNQLHQKISTWKQKRWINVGGFFHLMYYIQQTTQSFKILVMKISSYLVRMFHWCWAPSLKEIEWITTWNEQIICRTLYCCQYYWIYSIPKEEARPSFLWTF